MVRVLKGLLFSLFFSLALAGGRKPPEMVSVSMRLLSTQETINLLRNFPEMVPEADREEVFVK